MLTSGQSLPFLYSFTTNSSISIIVSLEIKIRNIEIPFHIQHLFQLLVVILPFPVFAFLVLSFFRLIASCYTNNILWLYPSSLSFRHDCNQKKPLFPLSFIFFIHQLILFFVKRSYYHFQFITKIL